MKKIRVSVCFLLFFAVFFLSSCAGGGGTQIELELTKDYSSTDPFIHEKLFYLPGKADAVELAFSFEMQGESGLIEIADNETKRVLWSDAYKGNVDPVSFSVNLDFLEQEKEYVVRFTGTKIEYAKVVITSDPPLIKERARPLKPNRDTHSL